jgi:hypothetical protein
MDGVETLLEEIRKRNIADGLFRGFLHLLIGRKIARADGTVVSSGMTWRTVADLLRRLRWPPEAVRELGLDPDTLSPRDRQRFWFTAISSAQIESPEASSEADQLAAKLVTLGYAIGPAPRAGA